MTTYFNMISGFCRYNPAGPEKAQQEQKNGEEVAQPKTCCEEIESLKRPEILRGRRQKQHYKFKHVETHRLVNIPWGCCFYVVDATDKWDPQMDQWDPWDPTS